MLLPTRPIFTLLSPILGKPKLALPGMHRLKLPLLRDRRLLVQPNFRRPGSPGCCVAAPLLAPATAPAPPPAVLGPWGEGPLQKPSLKYSPLIPEIFRGVA